jgi:uncharacterized protein
MKLPSGILLPEDQIAQFCKQWGIKRLELFGSALTQNFRPDSDIDLLATFDEHARASFEIYNAANELSVVLSRKIDLVSKQALVASRNKYRSRRILDSAQVIYDRA